MHANDDIYRLEEILQYYYRDYVYLPPSYLYLSPRIDFCCWISLKFLTSSNYQ